MSENTSQGPEPGTNEWAYETGNYIDPEPDWDYGEPHLDAAHGVAYWDTASDVDAGRERSSGYRHVGPDDPWWREPASDPAHPQHQDAVAAAREAAIEAADEWDDADSNAYQARVEAGLEPEAGQ